jgi:kinesin family protein 5
VRNTEKIVQLDASHGTEKFNFDAVFGQHTTQQEVFELVGVQLVNDVLDGFNCTLFAYGQSGSGKTFTMEGATHTGELAGMIPRITHRLFQDIANKPAGLEFAIKVSYVEIYNERVRCLLDVTGTKENLAVRQDKLKGVYIENVTEEYVTSGEEGMEVFERGSKHRAVAATGMNAGSSRSHAVFQIEVIQKNHADGSETSSRVVLCDLAGSETAKKTGAKGQQMEEAKSINKSLSALGQVIKALTDKKIKHIPFRDSKLTRMLQDAIGGNSRTTLMICLSPSKYNVEESVGTCRFGARAKLIKNKEKKMVVRSAEELDKLVKKAEATQVAYRSQLATLLQLCKANDIDAASAGVNAEEEAASAKQAERVACGKSGGLTTSASGSSSGLTTSGGPTRHLTPDELAEEQEEQARLSEEIAKISEMLQGKESRLAKVNAMLAEVRAVVAKLEENHAARRALEDESDERRFRAQDRQFAAGDLRLELETVQEENERLRTEGTAGDFDADRHALRTEVKTLKANLVIINKLHESMTAASAASQAQPNMNNAEEKMKQVGQRLKQMVLVHKSVLKKHAQAELAHRDTSMRIAARDRKIAALEESVANLKEHLHKQAQVQVEEMATVREHVTRLSTMGGGWFSKKRTLRGGGGRAAPRALSGP